MQRFAQAFRLDERTRVLDVGGTTLNWILLERRPDVTLLNLQPELVGEGGREFTVIAADGCCLPFRNHAFDVVFCNSLIEHLPVEQQQQLAAEIRRVAPACFVQTPNFWFPVEPHFYAPFFHWLPLSVRRRIVRWATPWGLLTRPSRARATAAVEEMRLLSARQLMAHFPGAHLTREKWLGLTKSLIVTRRQSDR